MIWPDVGDRNFVSRLKDVVLQAPFGPISAWMWPERTRRFTSFTATNPLNSFVRARVSRMTSPDMCDRSWRGAWVGASDYASNAATRPHAPATDGQIPGMARLWVAVYESVR